MDDNILDPRRWARAFASVERPDESASKDRWNAKATSFSHKRTRSGYIGQLIDRLDLASEESVFDMGCGPGTLTLPLAEAGHNVIAVDFSTSMLGELERAAERAGEGVSARIAAFERSWQQPWDDLPCADVAVASRSLITDDLADAFAKLESKARSRAVVTIAAGETPMCDLRLLQALGRKASEAELRREMAVIVCFLFSLGRLPKVDYLSFPRRWHAESREAMIEVLTQTARAATPAEEEAVARFVDAHASADERTGEFALDYEQTSTWGYVEWDVPRG